jgi:hypothetical protein
VKDKQNNILKLGDIVEIDSEALIYSRCKDNKNWKIGGFCESLLVTQVLATHTISHVGGMFPIYNVTKQI